MTLELALRIFLVASIGSFGFLAWRIHHRSRNPTTINSGWDHSPRSRALADPDGPHANTIERLRSLGFGTVGVRWEKSVIPGLQQRELVMAHPEQGCFAGVGTFELVPGFYLLSTFEGGAAVLTSNTPTRRGPPTPAPSIQGQVPGGTPSEVMAVHELRVSRLASEGRRLCRDLGFEGRTDAAKTWNQSVASSEMGRMQTWMALTVCLLAICLLTTFFFVPLG